MMVESTVKEIGEFSYFEEEPILILFNSTAPEGLREVCIIHDFLENPQHEILKAGSKIIFGNQEYIVEEIGNVANQTLKELGHVSLYFNLKGDQELLPGSVSLKPHTIPKITVGDKIKFIY